MDFMDIAALPAIAAVVYLCAFFLKNLCRSERFCRLIPPVCGLLGLALGLVCFFFIPGALPADNWLSAAATGAVSGLAATGAHQVYKQSREKRSGENGGAGGTLSDSTAPSDNGHQEDDGNDYA